MSLLKVPEVARELRVSPHKVRDLFERGILGGFRDGKVIRITAESVEALATGRPAHSLGQEGA